jgi:energy-coupling factor transporter transmembrane protein EcfT
MPGFRFQPSMVHGLDVRFKLGFLALLGTTILNVHLAGLLVLALFLLATAAGSRLPVFRLITEFRGFYFLLFFVFLARAASVAGTPWIDLRILVLTKEGTGEGVLVCFRLFLMAISGLVFIRTSHAAEVRAAVAWILTPIPFIPAAKISTMIGLLVRFFPVIFTLARDTSDAQRARCVECRKNPVYRTVRFAVPFLRTTFEFADRLVVAMEARAYGEGRTEPVFSATRKDWLALGVVSSCCLLALLSRGAIGY